MAKQHLTQKRLKLLIKILSIVKDDLPREYSRGLCPEILVVSDKLYREAFWKTPRETISIQEARRYLSSWINKMLGDSCTWYEDWIHLNHPHLFPRKVCPWDIPQKLQKKVQKGRIAWLNWMIQQLEKELK